MTKINFTEVCGDERLTNVGL